VRAGCEFIAARATLIEMMQEQQQKQQQGEQSEQQQGLAGRPNEGRVWVDRCVAGDRELLDTLLGLWGSLRPLRRLKFIWDLLTALVCGVSGKDGGSGSKLLANLLGLWGSLKPLRRLKFTWDLLTALVRGVTCYDGGLGFKHVGSLASLWGSM
jgi:hypothetical protein